MLRRRVLMLMAAAVLLAAACGDGQGDDGATTSLPDVASTAPQTSTTAAPGGESTLAPVAPTSRPTTTTSGSQTAPPTTEDTTVGLTITVAGGDVSGDTGRVPVVLGNEVAISVTSDTADEIHVHGYDVFADVAPGTPATVRFVADIPGIFEVELEASHVVLVELEVRP